MKTLFAILMLFVFALVANFLYSIVGNIAGLPGALLALSDLQSKGRHALGTIVAAIGQSYVYLAFVAFIVNWTTLAAQREDIVGFLLWPVAFLAVFCPMAFNLGAAQVEARETKHTNAQVHALSVTMLATLIGFFVFAFSPTVMRFGWGWLPYMK